MHKDSSARANDSDFQRSHLCANWVSWVAEVEVAIGWRTESNTYEPRCERPYPEWQLESTQTWGPYPDATMETNICSEGLTNARLNLFIAAADLQLLLLDVKPEDTPVPGRAVIELDEKLARLNAVDRMLSDWHASLPYYATLDVRSIHFSAPLADLQYVTSVTIGDLKPALM